MSPELIYAIKKVFGGILSVVLVAGIKKGKSIQHQRALIQHIQNELGKKPKEAAQLYGNDVDTYVRINYKFDTFKQLIVDNAFRPLIVVILISLFDYLNSVFALFLVPIFVLYIFVEVGFGEEWRDQKWYLSLLVAIWTVAFIMFTFSKDWAAKLTEVFKGPNQTEQMSPTQRK